MWKCGEGVSVTHLPMSSHTDIFYGWKYYHCYCEFLSHWYLYEESFDRLLGGAGHLLLRGEFVPSNGYSMIFFFIIIVHVWKGYWYFFIFLLLAPCKSWSQPPLWEHLSRKREKLNVVPNRNFMNVGNGRYFLTTTNSCHHEHHADLCWHHAAGEAVNLDLWRG